MILSPGGKYGSQYVAAAPGVKSTVTEARSAPGSVLWVSVTTWNRLG